MPIPDHLDITSEARLKALDHYRILDTGSEAAFDGIVSLAKKLCGTPVALVSLVTDTRQWFKAKIGTDICETPLSQSVCAHVVAERVALVIPDLTLDERTKDNTLVTQEPLIRFYAGVPLIDAAGHALGSLCVIDLVPRTGGLTSDQEAGLHELAQQVISQLELRRALFDLQEQHDRMQAGMRRQTALVDLGDTMRGIDTRSGTAQQDAIDAALRAIGEMLGTLRCGYANIDLASNSITVAGEWSETLVKSLNSGYSIASFPDSFESIKAGSPVAISDINTNPDFACDARIYRSMDTQAIILVPFLTPNSGRLSSVVYVHSGRIREWTPFEVTFVRAIADRLHSFVSRRAAEDFQHMLGAELSHRMKNTLTMVQAIASQTLGKAIERDAFHAFSQRIMALSQAHDVLLQQSWAAARIKATVESVLGLHTSLERFSFGGPDINLGPQTVLSLSLLLHELATNATKYGSLSVPHGHVDVSWAVKHGAQPEFNLTWRERGGPVPQPVSKRGFGSRLIKMGLSGTGSAKIDYSTTGVVAEFGAPLSTVTSS